MICKLLISISLFFGLLTSVCAQAGAGRPSEGGAKGPRMENRRARGEADRGARRNAAQKALSATGKTAGKVYLFGFSQAFGDTVAYLTDVCFVDSIALEKKTKFLPFRYEFSLQMKEYLEGKKGLKLQTSCVFYGKKRSTMQKRLAKMKKRYLNMDNTSVVTIKNDEFMFTHPLDR